MADPEKTKEEINKQLIAEIKSGSQKDVKHKLKTFYKLIQTIKEPLTKLIDINEINDNTEENVKGKGTEEDKYIIQLKGKLKNFGNEYNNITGIYKKYKKYLKQKKYSAILSDFLYYEKNVLQKFEFYQSLIKPYDDKNIETLYKDSLVELKAMYIINASTTNIKKIITESETTINNFLSNVLNYLIKDKKSKLGWTTNINFLRLADKGSKVEIEKIADSYIRDLYEKIPEKFTELKKNIIKKLKSLTSPSTNKKSNKYEKKDRNKAAEYYRSIIKALFMIMEKYYYYDLKYKHKFSYQTLNNSYKKSKIGRGKKFGRSFIRMGQSIRGKYKSKVKLGRKYRINPTFGFKKGTSEGTGKNLFSYNIKDLEKKKTALEDQIKEYKGYLTPENLGNINIGPKSKSTHFEYYEVKKRLAREIRKLKIIKFFLLRKTVRLKQRTFGKRPKLTNTISSLTAKIKSRTPKIFKNTKQNNRTKITNALSKLNTKVDINTARKTIKEIFDKIGVTEFRKNKKRKTLKRLKKLSKMVQAQELINGIDTSLGTYKTQNNAKSTQIRNEIMTKKIEINSKSQKTAKNYNALEKQLSNLGNGSSTEITKETINLKASLTKQNKEIEAEIKDLKEINDLVNTAWKNVTTKNLDDYKNYTSEQVKIAKDAKEITLKLEKAKTDATTDAADAATDAAEAATTATIAAATAATDAATAATAATDAATAATDAATAATDAAAAAATEAIDTAIAKIETAIKALDTLINKIGIKEITVVVV